MKKFVFPKDDEPRDYWALFLGAVVVVALVVMMVVFAMRVIDGMNRDCSYMMSDNCSVRMDQLRRENARLIEALGKCINY